VGEVAAADAVKEVDHKPMTNQPANVAMSAMEERP